MSPKVLDEADVAFTLTRDRWWQIWRPRHRPPPPPARLEDADVIPLVSASLWSVLTFAWITPIMVKGYQRPLQATDLWKLDPSREAMGLSRAFLKNLKARQDKAKPGKYGSLVWALNDTLTGFWSGGEPARNATDKGLFKVAGDTAALVAPLVLKELIRFSQSKARGEDPPIGRGVGMAFGLWGLTIFASICQHQFFYRSMATGVMARATLITALYQHSLDLSTAARLEHPNGKLLSNISSDVSRVDYCAQWFHAVWTAPIQLALCLDVVHEAQFRRAQEEHGVDGRSVEALARVAVVDADNQAFRLRSAFSEAQKELFGIRKILMIRAANQAVAFSVPTLASVLSFVVYSRTNEGFDPALIFTSLALFSLLRQPLMFLPRALSSVADAQNAFERLRAVFEAETTNSIIAVDEKLGPAIRIDASFSWTGKSALEADIEVARGELFAVIGPVGSGKSSLLQAIIGEMPKISGTVEVGGRIAYCQQSAWIQNATVRENVTFGQHFDKERYWQAIRDASLVSDLEQLPDGDLTEIGEKGVTLSGGQKQRVNIARALYFNADIVLLDDPLSAVDAHVGEALFNDAVLGLRRRGTTVVLVTHAVHFLADVDRICIVDDGRLTVGTHADLLLQPHYAHLHADFGGTRPPPRSQSLVPLTFAEGTGKLEGRLHISEKRKTGSVGKAVYAGYLRAGRAAWTLSSTLAFAIIMQGAQVMSTVWLTYWESDLFNRPPSFYEALYAALGVGQAIFTFAMGATLGIMSYLASKSLYSTALRHVFYAPMSVFDTQPLGRVLGVFGKDVDTADNQLADSLRMLAFTLISLIGSVIIITVYLHYFILVIFVVCIGYWYFSLYYRTSARELKRLDALLRGLLYSHFSESLSGLATIRAYGEKERFIQENAYYMDLENRAYLLTTVNQRWLSVRLDFLGGCIVFAVAIMAANGGAGISPAEIALCLTYMVAIVQILGMVTRQTAEVENNMNAVERILWYSTSLAQEPEHAGPGPSVGAIEFDKVEFSYRPGLPKVLKGVSFSVASGERVGIVGRTGAGKSSITVALYRLCEIVAGRTSIDGVDTATMGLDALRASIAIIPQDPVLFSGTLRSNLDPFDRHSDAELHDAIKRSHLSHQFTLDTDIADEGSNLSVGERSLISLARALVKNSPIIVLDEATAAVDLETDLKIQQTIATEFRGKTLLCIAHRIRSIISWDRILVMDAGVVKECDTPLALFDRAGMFSNMCMASGITREDILSQTM